MVSSSSSFNVSTRNVVDINRSSSSSSSLRRSCRMAAQTQTQAQADYTCTNSNSSTRAQQTLMNQKRCRHLYAQKLNNCASICIETGLYDRAILSLSKALKLSEQEEEEQDEPKQEQEQDNQDDDDDDVIMEDKNAAVSETNVEEDDEFEYEEEDEEDEMMICPCYHCTVDGCIEYSETNSDNNDDAFYCQAIGTDASFIYRRPIQVTPQSIQDGHNMGSTLCLIIAFNLALAYHLKAISTTAITTSSSSSSSSSKGKNQKYITVALKLYVHVIRWQTRLIRQQNSNNYSYYNEESNIHSGMRFKMILLSNMSQLHRQQNQTQNENETLSSQSQSQSSSSPYQLCLESLLSNIMLVVEYKTRIFNHNIASSSSSSPSSLPYIMIADLERFLQNTSPILMGRNSSCSSSSSSNGNGNVQQDQCASAA